MIERGAYIESIDRELYVQTMLDGDYRIPLRRMCSGAVRAVEGGGARVTVVASDGEPMRSGDIDPPEAWVTHEFERNPVMLIDHHYSVRQIAGQWQAPRFANGQMLVDGRPDSAEVSETGGLVRRLVASGSLRAVSPGFVHLERPLPIVDERGDMIGLRSVRIELIEISWVAVGDSRNALVSTSDDASRASLTSTAATDAPLDATLAELSELHTRLALEEMERRMEATDG